MYILHTIYIYYYIYTTTYIHIYIHTTTTYILHTIHYIHTYTLLHTYIHTYCYYIYTHYYILYTTTYISMLRSPAAVTAGEACVKDFFSTKFVENFFLIFFLQCATQVIHSFLWITLSTASLELPTGTQTVPDRGDFVKK